MHRRARSILRGEQGLSMILVLCIGALFVALSAALVYAASVLTANANRQLLEQEAYQLATSFSDVLEGELNKKDSSFAKFVNGQFMFSQSYGKDIYDLESQPKEFAWKPNGSQPDGGACLLYTSSRKLTTEKPNSTTGNWEKADKQGSDKAYNETDWNSSSKKVKAHRLYIGYNVTDEATDPYIAFLPTLAEDENLSLIHI